MLLDASSKRRNGRVLEMIFVLVRALALACRGHHELVLENLALRQQLMLCDATLCVRSSGRVNDCFGSCWLTRGGTGERPWCSCSPTPWCDGIANGSAGDGRGALPNGAPGTRVRTPPSAPSSTKWPPRIRSGERLGSMASWARWASSYRSEPSLASSGNHGGHPHRRGGPSSPITWRRSCRWTSLLSRRSLARPIRLCAARVPPPAHRPLQCHRASDRGVDGAAGH
jgi:hypothetical protein